MHAPLPSHPPAKSAPMLRNEPAEPSSAPSTTSPPAGPLGEVDWAHVKRRLMQPSRRQIVDWPEFLHPHAPPADDPEWPTPTTMAAMIRLLGRFAHRQQIWVAAIAAERVVPIWEQWLDERESPTPRPPTPSPTTMMHRHLIRVVQQWAVGDTAMNRVAAVLRETFSVHDAPYYADHRQPAHWASLAVLRLGCAAMKDVPATAPIHAALFAEALSAAPILNGLPAHEPIVAPGFIAQFLREWWTIIRCRLAFFDAWRCDFTPP